MGKDKYRTRLDNAVETRVDPDLLLDVVKKLNTAPKNTEEEPRNRSRVEQMNFLRLCCTDPKDSFEMQ